MGDCTKMPLECANGCGEKIVREKVCGKWSVNAVFHCNIELLNKSFLYDRVRPIMTPIVHWPRSPVHMLTWGVPPR